MLNSYGNTLSLQKISVTTGCDLYTVNFNDLQGRNYT